MDNLFWWKMFCAARNEARDYRNCKTELWIMRILWVATLLYVAIR